NRPNLFKKALRSIAEQTWPAVEAVVVNDGGTDVSEVASNFKKKISNGVQLIQYDAAKGRSAAANQGIESAKGEWIAFLDDDDTLEVNGLASLARHISWDKEFIYGQVLVMHMEPGKKRARKGDIWGDAFNADRLALENYIPICAFICKREHAMAAGRFDEKFDALEDWDFLFRLSQQVRFYYVSAIVANYCIWGESYYNAQDRDKERYFRQLFFEKNIKYYEPELLGRASLAFLDNRNHAVEATAAAHHSVLHSMESRHVLEINAFNREIEVLKHQLEQQKAQHDVELQQQKSVLREHNLTWQNELQKAREESNHLRVYQTDLGHSMHSMELLWRRRLGQWLKRIGRSITLESPERVDLHHYGVLPITRAFSASKNEVIELIPALDGVEEAIPVLSGKIYEWAMHWNGKKPAQLLMLRLSTGQRVNRCYLQLEVLRHSEDGGELIPHAIATFDGREAEDGQYGTFMLDHSLQQGEYVCRLTSPDADNMENTLFIWLTVYFKAQSSGLLFPNYRYSPPISESLPAEVHQLKQRPKISIVIPVYNPDAGHLQMCLDSVLNQAYPEWELCITDDASTKPYVKEILENYQARFPDKIKVAYNTLNQHIVGASNDALAMADGEFIGLLDHDDFLTEDALLEVAKCLNEGDVDGIDVIYSDEDKWDEEAECFDSPYFKPEWAPDMLKGQMYIGHFMVLRKTLVDNLEGFRQGFDGSQDWDLALRATEQARVIKHIPKILYHWRQHAASSASSADQKNYTLQAGLMAVQDALDREGEGGRARIAEINNCLVHYPPVDDPLVSIVIPTKDLANVLQVCIDSITGKDVGYSNWEFIIVDNGSVEKETFELFRKYKSQFGSKRFKVVEHPGRFNFSRLVNKGVANASGELVLMMNNDTELIEPHDWMADMAGYAQRKSVGCVGCKLLYPDNTLQHAGVVCGLGSVAGHSHKYVASDSLGYVNRLSIVANYSAVTAACFMVRREVWDEVSGFDENIPVAFNDVDFCLKLIDKGYYNVVLPHVQFYHYESKSRGIEDTPEKQARFMKEIRTLQNRWGRLLQDDPFYSPHLTKDNEQFSLNKHSIYFADTPEELF
ncbi:MAG: glycosyltransferase, partial [Pseudomonadota bacterium]